ncbi:MAG TPA: hypothetical protein VMM55_08350 [Thermohalobaculum sp.]|nr:hypothetical protein [Thermohalobaculum sp.]
MRAGLKAAALAAALAAGAAWAQQPLTLEVTPDDGTQFAVRCTQGEQPVIEHAGDEVQRFGFDAGPIDCRIRIVGEGGIAVEAEGPETQTRLRASGRDSVLTIALP